MKLPTYQIVNLQYIYIYTHKKKMTPNIFLNLRYSTTIFLLGQELQALKRRIIR